MNFGDRRICYNNFAGHLLNAYNPNFMRPELGGAWETADWRRWIDMLASFGFNVYEFWLEPFWFCRSTVTSERGRSFARMMNAVCDHAHTRGVKVEMLVSLATVGPDWRTLCPNRPDEWREIRWLWDSWTRALPGVDVVGIFPGDPGGCSLNGCTAETYIDRSVEISGLIKKNIPAAEIEFGTWGPPFFAWGNLQGPDGWNNEFIPGYQHTAWTFDPARAERSMRHLLKRLPDFPPETAVAINLGFNPDGKSDGPDTAIPWAREIVKTNRIFTWDFSLTEGENAILPHYRFRRLFEQRRRERDAAPYAGGICFTMTPGLNQLSLWESAQSFLQPDADPDRLAEAFYVRLFGPEGRGLVSLLPLFEVVPDWGNLTGIEYHREPFHQAMRELSGRLEALAGRENHAIPFLPDVDTYRRELLWFARWFESVSGLSPDYDSLYQAYWNRVYSVYDRLPVHVDPRPRNATTNLVQFFKERR
ncbi:MAG: hypothetical protein A2340_12850 [Lentisphaerae bacterium RIFOXYB12_FULL_60_10]|nr:MAG: hypothetical protein A2340_12850 [Lentisphaerae bacterium RIFOXYB12_FULL_60_10]